MERTVAEFFAGIGLMRMGLERAGWHVVWANDIDAQKKRMYEGHFGHGHNEFILEDVHRLRSDDLPTIELATASFPCNDLSLAGARRGLSGENSGAFWGFTKAIADMGERRPPLILLENVPGFLTSHGGNDFRDACKELNSLGYSVDAFLIDAARFVPQSRQRLFIIGVRTPRRHGVAETRRFYQDEHRPAALADFILRHPEISWSIRELPELPVLSCRLDDILEAIPETSNYWWSEDRASYLVNQMSARHRTIAEGMIKASAWCYGTVFRRVRNGKSMAELRTDGIAGCLRTPRGGSGRQILFRAGLGTYRVRLLTPVECARLMGADTFKIGADVSLNQALFGFGDAVCVPVIEWIAQNYLTPCWTQMHEIEREDQGTPIAIC